MRYLAIPFSAVFEYSEPAASPIEKKSQSGRNGASQFNLSRLESAGLWHGKYVIPLSLLPAT